MNKVSGKRIGWNGIVLLWLVWPVWAGWQVSICEDPTQVASSGEWVKASNLGQGAASQSIGGILYDTDYSNIANASATSDSWPDRYYAGADAAVSNLLNTGGKVQENAQGGPSVMTFKMRNLTVGYTYRFQLLLGKGGGGANLYGNGWSDYRYVGLGDYRPRLATYTWIADSDSRDIKTNAGVGQGAHYNLAYALHDITPLSADVNHDVFVDLDDLDMIASQWLKACAFGDHCDGTDLDRSGQVGMTDLVYWLGFWLKNMEPGLMGWWPLNDGSGWTATDWLKRHPGELHGTESADWVPVGEGYVLGLDAQTETDGQGEYVQIPCMAHDDFSISFWLRTTATAPDHAQWWGGKGMVDGEVLGGENDFGVALVGNKAAFGVGDAGGDVTVVSQSEVNDGYWHHIAATRQADTGQMMLYVDGMLEAEMVGPTGSKGDPESLLVGSLNRYSGQFLPGWFDDIRIYETELPADKVAQLADKVYPKVTPKKGFDLVPSKWNDWQNALKQLNAQWVYTWGLNIASAPDDIQFCPMKWGKWGSMDQTVVDLQAMKGRGMANYVMGFNEPDNADQSNMTVDLALELWPRLEEPGLPMVSPGCVHADNAWMKDFMTRADALGYRVDYVAVHWYGGISPDSLMSHLQSVYNLYHRPLWITEFASADWSASASKANKYSRAQVYTFLAEVLWRLEETDYVKRYSWFCALPDSYPLGPSALFEEDKATLTPAGRLYASWDGDIDGPDIGQPYYLHHASSHKDLRSPDGLSVAMGDISNTGGKVQWRLADAGDGWYFIENVDSGNRLSNDGDDLLKMVSASVDNDSVRWHLVPDQYGWYFIDHKATGRRLHYRNDWDVAGLVESQWTDGNVRWRFIKP